MSFSSAVVLRSSAEYHCSMDTTTPWSMGCIILVTLRDKSFTTVKPLLKSVSCLLDEKGHCLPATLLFVVILSQESIHLYIRCSQYAAKFVNLYGKAFMFLSFLGMRCLKVTLPLKSTMTLSAAKCSDGPVKFITGVTGHIKEILYFKVCHISCQSSA